MKNKALVAGASGLIGAAAIKAFLSAGWDVVGISRHKPPLPSGGALTSSQWTCVTRTSELRRLYMEMGSWPKVDWK
jgi:nucleoside-diphosphate-sugar epimerase